MKKVSILFLFMTLCSFGLFAQGGNSAPANAATISEVQVYDLNNGMALLEVRVSGSGTDQVTGGSVIVTPDYESRYGVLVCALSPVGPSGNAGNNGTILTATFPFERSTGNGPDFLDLDISVQAALIIIGSKTKKEANSKHYRY